MRERDRMQRLEALGIEVYRRRNAVPPPLPMPAAATAGLMSVLPASGGPVSAANLDWAPLREAVASCTLCELHRTRTRTVFGVGAADARLMFIGEAPGEDEDRQGEPFVGRAGQLLTQMIRALGRERGEVFIANVLKCRPPRNRDPSAAETACCRPYLERQIELVDPALIVAVGRIAAQTLLACETPIGKLRGQLHEYGAARRPLIVTYHPAYLLRSPAEKRRSWQDLQLVLRTLEQLGIAPRSAH